MLAGIYLSVKKDTTIFASTDSFRLSEFRVISESENSNESSLIIPKQTALELVRIITDDTTEVILSFQENQLLIQYGSIRLSSRLLTGRFPDYEGFFPTEYNTKAVMLRSECINTLKQVNLVARNNRSNICARFEHVGKVEFSS